MKAIDNHFPNGFESWAETHYEVVQQLNYMLEDQQEPITRYLNQHGRGGMWELARSIADSFELIHEGREWDGDWIDELETHIINHVNSL